MIVITDSVEEPLYQKLYKLRCGNCDRRIIFNGWEDYDDLFQTADCPCGIHYFMKVDAVVIEYGKMLGEVLE